MKLRYTLKRFWYVWTAMLLIGINIAGIFYLVAVFARESDNFALIRELKKPVEIAKRSLDIFFLPFTVKASAIPHYDLVIDQKALDKLNANLPPVGANEILRDENKATVKADLYVNGKKYNNVDVRYRGENDIHWGYAKKSWRIKFDKDEPLDGYRELHLIVPSDRGYLAEELNNYRARKLGLTVPDSGFVTMSINGQGSMAYWQVEGWDKEFLERHELRSDANVYNVLIDRAEELDGIMWYAPMDELNGWDKAVINEAMPPDSYAEMDRLLEVLRIEDDTEFYRAFSDIVDMDNFYTWQAHAILAGTRHGERTNLRLYFNNAKGKFEFIPWNIETHDLAPELDATHERFVSRVLSNPEYLYQRNLKLAQYIKGDTQLADDLKYVDTLWKKTKSAFYADRQKVESNVDLVASKNAYRQKLIDNWHTVQNALAQARVSMEVLLPAVSASKVLATLTITSDSMSSVRWQKLTAAIEPEFDGSLQLVLDSNANGSYDVQDKLIAPGVAGESFIDLSSSAQLLHPGRTLLPEPDNRLVPRPVSYTYFLLADRPTSVSIMDVQAEFENAIIGGPVTPVIRIVDPRPFVYADRLDDTFAEIQARHPFLRLDQNDGGTIVWPAGQYRIDDSVIIPKGHRLHIEPGTRIALSPAISIASFSPVSALGTLEKPISITQAVNGSPWGVFAILDASEESVLRYVNAEGGGGAAIAGVSMTGMVAAHYSDVTVEHSTFRDSYGDDGLNVKNAKAHISDSLFENNHFDALDLDFTSGVVRDSILRDNGNDGMDFSGSRDIIVANIQSLRNGDKGISVGEASAPRIINAILAHNALGIASKDDSYPLISNSILYRNGTNITLYQKKALFSKTIGLRMYNTIVWGGSKQVDAAKDTDITIEHTIIEGGYVGEGNLDSIDPVIIEDAQGTILASSSSLAGRGTAAILKEFGIEQAEAPIGILQGVSLR